MNKYFPLDFKDWCEAHDLWDYGGFGKSRPSEHGLEAEIYEKIVTEATIKIKEAEKRNE